MVNKNGNKYVPGPETLFQYCVKLYFKNSWIWKFPMVQDDSQYGAAIVYAFDYME